MCFNPSWQVSPRKLLPHFPKSRTGDTIRKNKSKKLLGWDTDRLRGKAKATQTNKGKQWIHSSLPRGRQVFSYPKEGRAPSWVIVTWEDKCHRSLLLFLPPASCTEHDSIRSGISLWSVSAVLAVFLPIPCALPACSLVEWGEEQKWSSYCASVAQQ